MTPRTRYPNVVQATVDGFCTNVGMVKRSGSWYQLTEEVGTVVNLQKSNYSGQGFLNVAVWLEPSDSGPFPKENECPIRTRLELLVPPDVQLPALLDADSDGPREEHAALLMAVLEHFLVPILNATTSLERLRTSDIGHELLARSLVKPAARRLLDANTGEN